MESLLLYILKSTVCLTLFYLSFKALLSNDTFFRFNRRVLLAGTGICMLLPLLRIEIKEALLIQQPILHLEKIISVKEAQTDIQVYASPEAITFVPDSPSPHISWNIIVWIFYITGSFVFLISTLCSFCKMFRIIKKGRKLNRNDHKVILYPGPVSPFSWGRYIILSEEDYYNHPDEILTHEKMHLRHHHTIDLIYMEILILLHWFNPAVWLLKRELKEIHEYQADRGVLDQGIDATKYQLLLVKKAVGSSHYTIANSFNHSKIKKRITMMLKEKSNSWARLKLLLLVPVGLIALNAFASQEVNTISDTANKRTQIPTDKSTINQQTVQQDYKITLVLDEPNGNGQIGLPCKTFEEIKHRVDIGQLKDAKVTTIVPNDRATTTAYLEKIKELLDSKGIKCKIDPTVPDQKKARRKSGSIYLIQDKQIKYVMNEESDLSLLQKISKSKPITIQPCDKYVLKSELEKVKKLLDDNEFESKINPEPYKNGNENQFTLYERHAKSNKNLDDRIKNMTNDSIEIISIAIGKNAPKELHQTVTEALKKLIPYKVLIKQDISE